MNLLFKTNIISLYGEKGEKWLDALPEAVSRIAKRYNLSKLTPVTNLSYNYVLSGFQDAQFVVLKLSLNIDSLKKESAALKAFAGCNAANVLAEEDGVLILKKAIPGTSLKSFFPTKDKTAIHISSAIIKKLHQAILPTENSFPHIKDWLTVLNKAWNIPAPYLQKARKLRDQLLQTSLKEVLLHGDLHHDNILKHEDEWIIIDPKGVLGDPTFEVTAFIRNPIPELLNSKDANRIIKRRIITFAQILELPAKRILEWSFVHAVLAWIWMLEDNCDVDYFKHLTRIFDEMSI